MLTVATTSFSEDTHFQRGVKLPAFEGVIAPPLPKIKMSVGNGWQPLSTVSISPLLRSCRNNMILVLMAYTYRDRDREREGHNRKQWCPVPIPIPVYGPVQCE